MVFRIITLLCYDWAVIYLAFFLMVSHWLHKCIYMITGPTIIPSHVWDYFTVLLHLFDADGQNRRHFTALWDCTGVSSPASSGGGNRGREKGVRDHKNFFQQGLQQVPAFQQCAHSNSFGVLPVYPFFHLSPKNEGLRIEQHEKHIQNNTGQWRRDINFLKHYLFQDSCHVIELMWLFAEWS